MTAYYNTGLFATGSGNGSSGPLINPVGPGSGTVNPDFGNWTDPDVISAFEQYFSYISNHPTSYQALTDLGDAYINVYNHFQGHIPSDIENYLNQAGGQNLIQDGIEIGAVLAAFNAGGGVASKDAYSDYLNSTLNIFNGLNPNSGSIAGGIQQWLQDDIGDIDKNFSAGGKYYDPTNGQFGIQVGSYGNFYDFDGINPITGAADPTGNYEFAIYQGIFSLAGGDIQNLQGAMTGSDGLAHEALMGKINQILGDGNKDDAIYLILALMTQQEPNFLNDINGNNDVMDQQAQYNSRYVSSINTNVNSIYNWNGTSPTSADIASYQNLQSSVNQILDVTTANSQFSSLGTATGQFLNYLQTTSIPYPPNQTATNPTTVTLYQLLIKGTDNSGAAIPPAEGAAALKQGMFPATPGTSTPSGPTPNTGLLQGFVGNMTAIGSAITNTSQTLLPITSQITNLDESLDKLAAAAIDPKNGLAAIMANANAKMGSQ
jgi:hypothetical protein